MTTRTIILTILAAAAALLALSIGCPPTTGPAEGECLDDGDCSLEGVLQACVDGACEEVDCLVNTDCPLAHHCDDGACAQGCEGDGDCLSGYHCDGGACVESECRSTVLDCYAGQFCQGGTCVDAGFPTCVTCDADDISDVIVNDNGTPFNPMDDYAEGSYACGGVGNYCLSGYPDGVDYCSEACTHTDQCPAAFECIPIVDGNNNEIGRNCIGPCEDM